MSVDIISELNLTQAAIQTLSGTTPNSSALIDMQGYEGLAVYLQTNTVTDAGTASGFTAVIQHSDTTVAGDFVTCTAAELVPNSAGATTLTVTADGTNDVLVGGVGYRGGKRYVRVTTTGTSGTNAVVRILFVRAANASASAPLATTGSTTAAT
jgi:hypothetical protein